MLTYRLLKKSFSQQVGFSFYKGRYAPVNKCCHVVGGNLLAVEVGIFIKMQTFSNYFFLLQHNFCCHSKVCDQEAEGAEGPVNQCDHHWWIWDFVFNNLTDLDMASTSINKAVWSGSLCLCLCTSIDCVLVKSKVVGRNYREMAHHST